MPTGPPLFPEDVLTDFPQKLAIADVIREKFFHVLEQELPHNLAIRVESLDEEGAGLQISATVLVARESQKGIVIGNKGRLLRRVKRSAERELQDWYEKPVHLDLWVKAQRQWTKNFWLLKQLGYE